MCLSSGISAHGIYILLSLFVTVLGAINNSCWKALCPWQQRRRSVCGDAEAELSLPWPSCSQTNFLRWSHRILFDFLSYKFIYNVNMYIFIFPLLVWFMIQKSAFLKLYCAYTSWISFKLFLWIKPSESVYCCICMSNKTIKNHENLLLSVVFRSVFMDMTETILKIFF